MRLRVLSLAAIAILALGATPPAPAAWTITLRDSCAATCAARTYTVDANGNASYAYGYNLIPSGTRHPVTLDPAASAAIARDVANAHTDRWVQTYISQPHVYRAFGDSGYMHPDVDSSPRHTYTLTMMRPGEGDTVKTALAEWTLGSPTIEPNDAVALAATIDQAFRPLVR